MFVVVTLILFILSGQAQPDAGPPADTPRREARRSSTPAIAKTALAALR